VSAPATTFTKRGTGLALAVAGAMAFSVKSIIVKLSYRHGVDAVTVMTLRMVFALPFFALLAWWAGRGQRALAGRDWRGVLGLGVCGYYLSSFLDFLGLQYVTASLERLILYLNPTLVLLLGWLMYRRPWRRSQLAGLAVSYLGIVVVFGQELRVEGANVALGTACLFGAALTYAVYLVYSGDVVKRVGALRLVGLATSVACVLAIGHYLLLRPAAGMFAVPTPVIWLGLLNAVLCTVVPVLMVMLAVERVGPAVTAQTGLVGPITTILLGVWLLGEPFTPAIAAGTVLVIAGIFVFTRGAPR